MPCRKKPPVFPLDSSDLDFIAKVESVMHMILDRLPSVVEQTPTPDEAPLAPPHSASSSAPAALDISFVPYARELLRSTKTLQILANLWTYFKTVRTQFAVALESNGENPELDALLTALIKRYKFALQVINAPPAPAQP